MLPSEKKVVDYNIKRLQDKSPAIRLKAIRELELLPHVDSLDALRKVYDEDPDSDVRKAAQEAGRRIFIKLNQTSSEA